MSRLVTSFGVSLLAVGIPAAVLGAFHELEIPADMELTQAPQRPIVSPTPSSIPTPSATPEVTSRAVLRQPRHVERLTRVSGIVLGMANMLQSLYERVGRHLVTIERRIQALQEAGHVITVTPELDAAHARVKELQATITTLLVSLRDLSESERPRVVLTTIQRSLRQVRTELRAVQAAFRMLRLAIVEDVRSRPTPSPSPSASVSPTTVPLRPFSAPAPTL